MKRQDTKRPPPFEQYGEVESDRLRAMVRAMGDGSAIVKCLNVKTVLAMLPTV